MEISVLTAVVLGGTSLGGGRGSVFNAIIGAVLVLMVSSGLIRLGVPGSVNLLILGLILILAVLIDAKWVKNRGKILGRVYVSPTYLDLPAQAPGTAAAYVPNDRLRDVETIGLGEIEGPEDVILDKNDHLYCGTRHGTIVRFLAPDYQHHEVFAHIGGHPLGLAFDADDNLVTCVGGMGVYRVSPAGVVGKVTDETSRSALSIVDDSRLRLPDDLDIAHDGRIFFSEATIRYEMSSWALDALEGRGNGRIMCFDPRTGKTRTVLRNLIFPNGLCMCPDGQSFLFPPHRPLPVALPEHQHRMRAEVFGRGCGAGDAVGHQRREASHGDLDARAQRLALSRRNFEQPDRPLPPSGCGSLVDGFAGLLGHCLVAVFGNAVRRIVGRRGAGVTIPVMDGPLRPNRRLDEAELAAQIPAVDNLVSDGATLLCSSGPDLVRLATSPSSVMETGRHRLPDEVTALAAGPGGLLAAGLAGGGVTWRDASGAWTTPTRFGMDLGCVTALLFLDARTLIVANGSTTRPMGEWKRDLMSGGRTGAVLCCDLAAQSARPLAVGLGFPYGLALDETGRVLVSESWRHRVIALDAAGKAQPKVVLDNLPAYPARLSRTSGGGFWLALFAPRNQLVEFILQEDDYRRGMMAEVEPDAWVAPSLGRGRAVDAPIQAGAVRQMGILKPWAPSLSCGLVVSCDAALAPRASLHSRTDGSRHGVTSVVEHDGALFVAAKGADCLLRSELQHPSSGMP